MVEKNDIVGRIAPTPSGYLHLGNAVSFIITSALVKSKAGQLRLRIDDLDSERTRPEFIEDIFRQLDWLGIEYDLGPESVSQVKNFSQHQRLARYEFFIDKLYKSNSLYVCNCSRREIKDRGELTYQGHCYGKHLQYSKLAQLRLNVSNLENHLPKKTIVNLRDELLGEVSVDWQSTMGDFVVKRKNGLASYQLASLIDDYDYGINFIVRGVDLLASTAAQVYLSKLLVDDLSNYSFSENDFYHHELITDKLGKKLSKSQLATSLNEHRNEWKEAKAIYAMVAKLLNIQPEQISNMQDLVSSLKDLYSVKR